MAAVEIRVEVTAPDLSAAISELAHAIRARQEIMVSPNVVGAVMTGSVQDDHPEPEAYQKLEEYIGRMQAAQPEPVPVAPSQPAPVPVPVAPVPAPVPVPSAPAPVPAPVPVPSAPLPAPEPVPVPVAPMPAPEPVAPVPAPATNITLQQIARAGASLVDRGKKAEVIGVLRRYGVQAVTQLKPEQFGQFAGELRALGAQI